MKNKFKVKPLPIQENQPKMKQNTKCLSVSKRHEQDWEIVEDYSTEWNTPYTSTIFRIVREFDRIKKKEYAFR